MESVQRKADAVVFRLIATAMWARIITSMRSIPRLGFLISLATRSRPLPRLIRSSPHWAITPCGNNQNGGDPFAFYDHQADRWVISDFAFPGFPGPGPFYQCIAVSPSGDPTGTYTLYALQHEPSHTTWLGDYPKFAMWNDGGTQNAYFFTVNLFQGSPSVAFEGVRAYALDRASMIAGGPANAIGFTVPLAGVGDSYSFVAATFRTGDPPPAGRDEMVLAIDTPATGGVTLTQVHARFFHVDFANPGDSTFGVGADHTPNAEITVDGFVDAFTNTTTNLVPQQGTSTRLDTLGDKIMTPVVYQNRGGTESLWAESTVSTTRTALAQPVFVGISLMLRAVIFLTQRCNSKPGPIITTGCGAGCQVSL